MSAKSAGVAIITATAKDGSGKSGSCIITVEGKEKVSIVKDTNSFKICFNNGLIWKNIGYDLSNMNVMAPQAAIDNYNYNKTESFSEKQLAFIYLFDPLGVEHYLRLYYLHSTMQDAELLFFKDRVYQEIFGVKPRYFRKLPNEQIVYFDNSGLVSADFRNSVYSYAEVLFGAHIIYDALSIVEFLTDILIDIFTMIPVVSVVALGIEMYQALFFSGSMKNTLSSGASIFFEEYIKSTYGAQNMVKWASNLFGVLGALGNAYLDAFAPPNLNDITIYHKIASQNFHANFVIEDTELTIEEIIDHCIVS